MVDAIISDAFFVCTVSRPSSRNNGFSIGLILIGSLLKPFKLAWRINLPSFFQRTINCSPRSMCRMSQLSTVPRASSTFNRLRAGLCGVSGSSSADRFACSRRSLYLWYRHKSADESSADFRLECVHSYDRRWSLNEKSTLNGLLWMLPIRLRAMHL